MSQTQCDLESDSGYEKRPAHTSRPNNDCRVSRACLDRLRNNITRLPGLYRDCEDLLASRPRRGMQPVRNGRRAEGSLSVGIVAARLEMLSVAASWARYIADNRPVSQRPHRRMPDLARFLLKHLSWLGTQDVIGDASSQIARIVRLAEQAIDPGSVQRMKLGRCDRTGCGGTVYAVVGRASGTTRVGCDRGHRWQPNEWLLLSQRLAHTEDGQPPVDVPRMSK